MHTDSTADKLSRSLQADAVTTGNNIFFRKGTYQPGTSSGDRLIGHELAHVATESGGAGRSIRRFRNMLMSADDFNKTVPSVAGWVSGKDPSQRGELAKLVAEYYKLVPGTKGQALQATDLDKALSLLQGMKTIAQSYFNDGGLKKDAKQTDGFEAFMKKVEDVEKQVQDRRLEKDKDPDVKPNEAAQKFKKHDQADNVTLFTKVGMLLGSQLEQDGESVEVTGELIGEVGLEAVDIAEVLKRADVTTGAGQSCTPYGTGVLPKPVTWHDNSRLQNRFEIKPGENQFSYVNQTEARVAADLVKRLDTFEHREYLQRALHSTSRRFVIISPWITASVVNTGFLESLGQLLRKGIRVHIGYGLEERPDDRPMSKADKKAEEALQTLSRRYNNFTLVKLGNTHSKQLLFDDTHVCGSFNWLNFVGDRRRTYRHAESTVVRRQDLVEMKYRHLVLWSICMRGARRARGRVSATNGYSDHDDPSAHVPVRQGRWPRRQEAQSAAPPQRLPRTFRRTELCGPIRRRCSVPGSEFGRCHRHSGGGIGPLCRACRGPTPIHASVREWSASHLQGASERPLLLESSSG